MSAGSTRARLLEAAVALFAEKGYRDATIADVCERANANIAAVNYHFDSKENLFRHVLREAFEEANAVFPIDGGLSPDAPPEERLLAHMAAAIRRNLDPGPAGCLGRIMAHDGTRQAAPAELIHSEMASLQGDALDAIIAELIGTRARRLIHAARVNVIALCVFPALMPPVFSLLFQGDQPTPAQLNRFIKRQHAFALAGLSSLSPAIA